MAKFHVSMLAVILLLIFLSACGGRGAYPIRTEWHDDDTLSCAQLKAEQRRNNTEISELKEEKSRRNTNNAKNLCFFICILPLFDLDLNNAQDIEIDAYQKRNQLLEKLYQQKKCTATSKGEMTG